MAPDLAAAEAAAVASLDSATILVVDDDRSNRESLSRRLIRRGYQVSTAEDGADALRQIDAQKFDLVLLDVMMPGISGLEVLQKVRETVSATELPIIMATANDRSEDVVKALSLGANDYVTKPLDFSVVVARTRTQLLLKRAVDQVLQLERSLADRNVELELANLKLTESNKRTQHELETAARVQASLLPTRPPVIGKARFSWAYEPCDALSGDFLNVLAIDENHAGFYVLDASGHGVAASLLAVAAARLLSTSGRADSILVNTGADGSLQPATPSEVATRLSLQLPFDSATEQFLTLFYAILDTRTNTLCYTSAGHPGAIRVGRDGNVEMLEGSGLPIGVGDGYNHATVQLNSGDRVFIYSDGVIEAMDSTLTLFGLERLVQNLRDQVALDLPEGVLRLVSAVRHWQESVPPKDDLSILAVECG